MAERHIELKQSDDTDGTDVYINGRICCHNFSDSQLRSCGFSCDLRGTFRQFRDDFCNHIRRVDEATKLTQRQADSQLKRAREVLRKFDDAFEALEEYRFANVSCECPVRAR